MVAAVICYKTKAGRRELVNNINKSRGNNHFYKYNSYLGATNYFTSNLLV